MKKKLDCPCTNKGCPNNGYCEPCQKAHKGCGEPTACGKSG